MSGLATLDLYDPAPSSVFLALWEILGLGDFLVEGVLVGELVDERDRGHHVGEDVG